MRKQTGRATDLSAAFGCAASKTQLVTYSLRRSLGEAAKHAGPPPQALLQVGPEVSP